MTHQLRLPWYRRPAVQIVATVLVTGLAGLTGGTQLAEPQRVVETRIVTETPRECLAALDEADRALVVGTEFGQLMVGLADQDNGVHYHHRGGHHYQDSERFLTSMRSIHDAYRTHKTACLAPANGGRSGD